MQVEATLAALLMRPGTPQSAITQHKHFRQSRDWVWFAAPVSCGGSNQESIEVACSTKRAVLWQVCPHFGCLLRGYLQLATKLNDKGGGQWRLGSRAEIANEIMNEIMN